MISVKITFGIMKIIHHKNSEKALWLKTKDDAIRFK